MIFIYKSKLYHFIRSRIDELQVYKLLEQVKKGPIPKHIAIIMDGNRRFAKDVGLKPEAGHIFGRDKIEETLDWCMELGIKNLTLYAFSTENFNRKPEEVEELMNLCRRELQRASEDKRIHKNRIKINVIGHLESLPQDIQKAAKDLMEKTKDYNNYSLNIALAYGGREEILQAIRKIAEDVEKGEIKPEEITEEDFSKYLYTKDIPDPDLILRTSGEERISNFLLWQLAYSELYFSDVYWPAFQKKDFLKAISTYQQRKRRFGR
ncbi:MAG: di-trans,poly-cis-decaprenylcistransferase [Thermoplasmata archaeon]|nr:MAG: di-trans,poly-cis-decaprenylcistransferase [Thermoplasmata archaeon]